MKRPTFLDILTDTGDPSEIPAQPHPIPTESQITDFIKNLGDHEIDEKTDPKLTIYKAQDRAGQSHIFAIIHKNSNPLRLEAKCDPRLAKLLRRKYETILPSRNMDKSHWNEIINTGQLAETELTDLIRLSHNLITTTEPE